jgi:GPH family glycoside/pentoside/hexuronide:cation symporter
VTDRRDRARPAGQPAGLALEERPIDASGRTAEVATAPIETTPEPAVGSEAARGVLPLSNVLVYSAPALGQSFMFMFTGMYLLKYSTDVLGVAPAAMGMIFMVSKFWDAFSDPLAGYLSDRTQTRWGRRRPWMLAGALPVCVVFFLMLTPPESLQGGALTAWMAACVIGFYTMMTIYNMPHDALGAELTSDYSERNRIFGIKRAVFGLGTVGVFAVIGLIADSDAPRELAFAFAAVTAAATLVLLVVPVFFLEERPEFQGRGAKLPFKAVMDVLRNRHARLLVGMYFLQQIGIGGLSLMVAYWADYVLGDAKFLSTIMMTLFLASIVGIPFWIRLGRRFEKRTLGLVSMIIVGAALASIGLVPEGGFAITLTIAAIAGLAVSCLDVILPSIQADVIDYDELQTSERKEGVYFAVWHLAAKMATGIAAGIVGFVLQGVGFDANAEQTPETIEAIRLVMSAFPLVVYGAGTCLFWFFSMTKGDHADVLAALEVRREAERNA